MNDALYKDFILELYRHPLNKKELMNFDVEQHEHNPLCGDDITVRIKFGEDGKVIDIGFVGEGCAISQAAMSLLTDEIKNKTKEEILQLTEEDVIKLLGVELSYSRLKCALLGLKAIHNSLQKSK